MPDVPVVGVTLGDPAGIGPEVLVKSLGSVDRSLARLVFYGVGWSLDLGARFAGETVQYARYGNVDEIDWDANTWPLIELGTEQPDAFEMGRISAVCGEVAVRAVETAARDALRGRIAAMMTCPIHKEAIHLAGYVDDIGHQEILARVANAEYTATMLMTPGLKVVHLSTHKSLIEAASDAGATGWQTLWHVIIPLTKPGIMIGTIFVVTLVMGDFITVRFMSGSQSANVGRMIQNDIALLQYPSAAATAVVLLITVLIVIAILLRFVDIRKEL